MGCKKGTIGSHITFDLAARFHFDPSHFYLLFSRSHRRILSPIDELTADIDGHHSEVLASIRADRIVAMRAMIVHSYESETEKIMIIIGPFRKKSSRKVYILYRFSTVIRFKLTSERQKRKQKRCYASSTLENSFSRIASIKIGPKRIS